MRSYQQYLRKRFVELPIWLGIPFIGVFLTVERPPGGRLLLFGLAATLAISHLLLVNDWGGLKRAPLEIARYPDIQNGHAFSRMLRSAAVLTLLTALLVGSLLLPSAQLFGLVVSGGVLSVLYSHPTLHLKENPVLSSVLHLMGGTLLFVLGVAVFSGDMATGLTIGVFFGMVLMGGHFIHECVDHDEDARHQVHTSATRWGISHAARLGTMTFFVAHAYLLLLAYLGIMSWPDTAIFSFLVAVYLFFCRRVIGAARSPTRTTILEYKRLYRIAFAASSVVFVFGRILSLV